MKLAHWSWRWGFIGLLVLGGIRIEAAALVSRFPADQAASATAAGDSLIQAISPDGRFVLFVSTADNLVVASNQTPQAFPKSPRLNLFRRDRQSGANVLVSANLTGSGGAGDSSGTDLSTNGNVVVFESTADDLVTADTNGVSDVFVRSLDTGVTTLVSVSTNGGCADGASRNATMTPDGRYVAFVSAADNLVAHDTNRLEDVFVRDLQTGQTQLASVGAVKTSAILSDLSTAPQISADGRYVAFFSSATNLVTGVITANEIYVRDLEAGTTYCASSGAHELLLEQLGSSNAFFYNLALSADGHYVAFEGCRTENPLTSNTPYQGVILRYQVPTGIVDVVHTNAYGQYVPANAVLPEDLHSLDISADGRLIAFLANTNGTLGNNTCVLLWDAQTGTNTLISGGLDGSVTPDARCLLPQIDPSGRYVAFLCNATNLVTNNITGDFELYCRDLQAGQTLLVSAGTNGVGGGGDSMTRARFNEVGPSIAFDSAGANLVADDKNHAFDVFVRNLTNDTAELVSARDSARPSRDYDVPGPDFSASADGRFVAYVSDTDDLTPDNTNRIWNVYVRDQLTDAITLVSVSTNGTSGGNAISGEPVISGDGRYVAFSSEANNLTADDADLYKDIFVRDLETATTLNISGSAVKNVFSSPQMDLAGQHLLFKDGTGVKLYLADLKTLAVTNLAIASGSGNAITPDGNYVVYFPVYSSAQKQVAIWDTRTNAMIWSTNLTASSATAPGSIAISPNAGKLAFWDNATLRGIDLGTGNNSAIATANAGYSSRVYFSADGRYLVYRTADAVIASDTNNLADIYVYDFLTGSNSLVSLNPAFGLADGASAAPEISPDGRYVAFRSAASNLVADDTNGLPDIFMWDRTDGGVICLSREVQGGAADNGSSVAKFTPDGHSVLFRSWAQNLAPDTFNWADDLFAYNFLFAHIDASLGPADIRWQIMPGTSYHVEYTDSLKTPNWQPLSGDITISGNAAHLNDSNPGSTQRWYRVVGE